MSRPLAIFATVWLASCTSTHATVRISEAQVSQLREGMAIEEVREILGRPSRLVVKPFEPRTEVHRYVMTREAYKVDSNPAPVSNSGYQYNPRGVLNASFYAQNRELWLTYVNGKLVRE